MQQFDLWMMWTLPLPSRKNQIGCCLLVGLYHHHVDRLTSCACAPLIMTHLDCICVNKIARLGHMRWTWNLEPGVSETFALDLSDLGDIYQGVMVWSIRSPCRPGQIYLSACASPLSHTSDPCPLTCYPHTKRRSIPGWWNRSIFQQLVASITYIHCV